MTDIIEVPEDGWQLKLTYFKPSGTLYCEGSEAVSNPNVKTLDEIWSIVRGWKDKRCLPDLFEGHSDVAVLIEVPNHPNNHLHLIPSS